MGTHCFPSVLSTDGLADRIDALPSPVPGGRESQGAGRHLRLQRIFLMCLSARWVLVC